MKEQIAFPAKTKADHLDIANKGFVFQNKEKEELAAELTAANQELVFQNQEKEKRALELIIANKELVFQNEEKEKLAAELIIANKELVFQNLEKEKRALELIIANKELVFQNEEKEKRAAELTRANEELRTFNFISSHDLQEPLRKIATFSGIILSKEHQNLSDNGKDYFQRVISSVVRMQQLLGDILAYSRVNAIERNFEQANLDVILEGVKAELKADIEGKHATIDATEICPVRMIPVQFHQLMYNLLSNALKFSRAGIPPHIIITSRIAKGNELNIEKLLPEKEYCHITVRDNGIGFEPEYSERIFIVFQKLHNKNDYSGTGIGLAIVKKIIENHNGVIIATGKLNEGARFDIYLPAA
jgi:light-regulated signal transduction histidine kinase (bacteriophytochrome)